ncbi:kinesin light chain [Cordyceps javanica]|nr:kinesin light chain [Cordyceps javanica]
MKNALRRDELRDLYNMIGLEMEAAGTMNRIPVGVIRGVCDYGDEHKNKEWQPYAAAMAAAYAKAVLAQIGPSRPTIYYVPFSRNPNFTGRRTQFDQLERMLFRENRERVAVVGLGGMGKTQIALELAYRVRNLEVEGLTERYSVFWVPAQSMATFHKTTGELVQRLNIQCGDDDPKEVLRTYLESDAAGRWLLVVDNIDDTVVLEGTPGQSDGLSDFLPRSRKGRILITTCRR